MATSEMRKIEDAIGKLTPGELDELYSWLDHNHPQPIYERLATDIASGGADRAIMRALDDEASSKVRLRILGEHYKHDALHGDCAGRGGRWARLACIWGIGCLVFVLIASPKISRVFSAEAEWTDSKICGPVKASSAEDLLVETVEGRGGISLIGILRLRLAQRRANLRSG